MKTNQDERAPLAEAERTIAELEHKAKSLATAREADDAERSRLAFAAHARSDPAASKALAALTERALRRERELGDIAAALTTARARLATATAEAAKQEDRAQARDLRAATREFIDAGRRVDQALSMLARSGAELIDAHRKINSLGCAFPSANQLDSLGHICLRSAIMQTPWVRSVETVAPGQRRSFRSLIETWAANIESNNIRPRLGETDKAA
jgi:hypothetical protein